MSRKEFNNCPVSYNENCASNRSCAPVNACSREGIYFLLIVIALIAILVAFYLVFNYLFY